MKIGCVKHYNTSGIPIYTVGVIVRRSWGYKVYTEIYENAETGLSKLINNEDVIDVREVELEADEQ